MPTCKTCKGTGGVPCPKCHGKGTILTGVLRTVSEQCRNCAGSGKARCGVCSGKGRV